MGRTSMTEVLAKGLLAQNSRRSNASSRAWRWPPPGTGTTARNPRLLSHGTSRQRGVGPMAVGRPLDGSLLARSPAVVALINMHSWPGTSGSHSKGPEMASPPDTIPGMTSDGVFIGFQSSGQTRPAAGRAGQEWTGIFDAEPVPRFLTLT